MTLGQLLKTDVVDGVAILVERAHDQLPLAFSLIALEAICTDQESRERLDPLLAEVLLVFQHGQFTTSPGRSTKYHHPR